MQRTIFGCLAMLAGLLAGGSTALADKTFAFVQVGESFPPGSMTASGSLIITDAAFRSGLDVDATFSPDLGADLNGTGIEFLDFEATSGRTLSLFGNIFPPTPGHFGAIFLSSPPRGTPTGNIDFVIDFGLGGDSFEFGLGLGQGTASFSTDEPGTCNRTGFCRVRGLWEPVGFSVPEPATVSLLIPFAVGLLAMGRCKRNRMVRRLISAENPMVRRDG